MTAAESSKGRGHGTELVQLFPTWVNLTDPLLSGRGQPPEYAIWFLIQKGQDLAKLMYAFGSQDSGYLWGKGAL